MNRTTQKKKTKPKVIFTKEKNFTCKIRALVCFFLFGLWGFCFGVFLVLVWGLFLVDFVIQDTQTSTRVGIKRLKVLNSTFGCLRGWGGVGWENET